MLRHQRLGLLRIYTDTLLIRQYLYYSKPYAHADNYLDQEARSMDSEIWLGGPPNNET